MKTILIIGTWLLFFSVSACTWAKADWMLWPSSNWLGNWKASDWVEEGYDYVKPTTRDHLPDNDHGGDNRSGDREKGNSKKD